MIKLIFRKKNQFLLSFKLDEEGGVSDIVGDDSWFDYGYAPSSISKSQPSVWANLLKEEYEKTGIFLTVEEGVEKNRNILKKAILFFTAILVIFAGAFFLVWPDVSKGPKSKTVVNKTRSSFEKKFKQGSAQFKITMDKTEISGSFKKGVVTLRNPSVEKTWTNKFLFAKTGSRETKTLLNTKNDFRRPFLLTVFSLLPKKINIVPKMAKTNPLKKEITASGVSLSDAGIVSKNSRYRLVSDKESYLPLKIEVVDPSKPLGSLLKTLKIEFQYS